MTNQQSAIARGMFTPEDVAAKLNKTKRAILNMARKGKLTRYRFGRDVRFKPSEVETFIERSRA